MSRKIFSAVQLVTVVTVGACVFASLAFIKPLPSADGAGKQPAGSVAANVDINSLGATEEGRLVSAMANDGVINEAEGYVVEVKENNLYVNNKQVAERTAAKYLKDLKKKELRIEVHPFSRRLLEHPDAQFIQVALPVLMSSPCVVSKLSRPGC